MTTRQAVCWLGSLVLLGGLTGCGPAVAEINATALGDPDGDQQPPGQEQPIHVPTCTDTEICTNGVDDDCNGIVDCKDPACRGLANCCVPSSEICNGLDDNCDGVADDGIAGLGQPCTFGVGACASIGQNVCSSDGLSVVCNAVPRAPGSEQCGNGLDDDCDGSTDCNDPDCSSAAECQTCTPRAELCNGVDDDCDGVVDNGFANLGQTCHAGVGACGADGHFVCNQGGTGTVCNAVAGAPDAERCSNGIDDDCDGTIDCFDSDCRTAEHCRVPCEETEGGNCNGDDGHGDACASADNSNGCSSDKFWAWCNRRNRDQGCADDLPEYGCIWEVYLRGWVDQRCDRPTIELFDLDGSGNSEFVCTATDGFTYTCTTPLVLSFDRAPVQFLVDTGAPGFDLSAAQDGSAVRTDWPTAATPWLALDRDGDGRISSGRELFGSATRIGERTASNGFEALAALDTNRDRVIDRRDPAFAQLLVWTDRDGDRVSQASELRTLSRAGVVRIDLEYQLVPRCDARGNCEVERARFVWQTRQGALHDGALSDVHLPVRPRAPLAIAGR